MSGQACWACRDMSKHEHVCVNVYRVVLSAHHSDCKEAVTENTVLGSRM